MKTTIALCLLCLIAIPGCITSSATVTPQQAAIVNVQNAETAWTMVLTTLNIAESSGLVKASEVAPYQPVIDATTAALDAAAANAQSGTNLGSPQAIQSIVAAALPKLAPLLETIANRKAAATQPVK